MLATYDDLLRKRLEAAWSELTVIDTMARRERFTVLVPDWLAEEVAALRASWQDYPAPQIPNAIKAMSDAQCVEAAKDILNWYSRLRDER